MCHDPRHEAVDLTGKVSDMAALADEEDGECRLLAGLFETLK